MRRLVCIFTGCIGLVAAIAGCQESGYRTETVGNGQGGVIVRRVPVEAAPTPPRDVAHSAPAFAQSMQSSDDRIKELEQQIRALNGENIRLKQQLATRPSTQP